MRESPFKKLAPACADQSYQSRINRTKMFHVKHFGTIDDRAKLTFAKRGDGFLDGIFCPVREESARRGSSQLAKLVRRITLRAGEFAAWAFGSGQAIHGAGPGFGEMTIN
jgi:hypothetical protein